MEQDRGTYRIKKYGMEVTSDFGKHQFLYKTKSKNIEQG